MSEAEKDKASEAAVEPAAEPAAEPVEPAETKKPRRARAKKAEPVDVGSGYAVVETGGKQYRVKVGDRISVERIAAEAGNKITLDRVLLLGGAGETRVGTPVVEGATVTATVDDHFRGQKLDVFKYKPKKRYRRKIGHRQSLTHLTITAIEA
jgi:large subunit ribosomal protein L21